MQDLISTMKHDVKVVRLGPKDARGDSAHLHALRDLIYANEDMYPGIDKWFESKVIPGLSSSERVAFVGYLEEKPAISAVVKRKDRTKFCHLRIETDLQGNHLGELFFILMALEVRNCASEIHFTLPEGLWSQKRDFFESFGFVNTTRCSVQYRL